MSNLQKVAGIGLSTVLATTLSFPATAYAVPNNDALPGRDSASTATAQAVASGTWGSCRWTVDGAGALVIDAGTGASVDNSCPWSAYADRITSVSFSGLVNAPGDISGLFRGLYHLRSVDLTGFNTSKTTDVHALFEDCHELAEVNLAAIDTKNVTLFDALFRNCRSLVSIDISGLDTSKGMRFEAMFQGCESLRSIGFSGIDTSSATHMENMFQGCTSLVDLDASALSSDYCSYFQNMFADCISLKTLDISGLNTTSAVNMEGMFASCNALEHIRIGNQFSFTGSGSSVLAELPSSSVNGHEDWFSSTTQGWMTAGDIARTQNRVYAVYAKYPVSYEEDPHPSSPIEPGDVTASGMWGSCPWALDDEGTLVISTGSGAYLYEDDRAPWHAYREHIKHVSFEGRVVAPVVACGMFRDLANVESIDLRGLDVSRTEVLNYFFYGCGSLLSVDLSPLDTGKVINTNNMFSGCRSLTEIDLSQLDTSSLRQMDEMFQNCISLQQIDLRGLDTSNATKMGYMFYGCSSLRYVDLSPLDMSKNTSLAEMFAYCTSLKSVNLKGLNLSSVTAMDGMFNGCESLESIDFSGLDTSRVVSFKDMFTGCKSLRVFDASNLDTRSATTLSYMFCGCESLTVLDLSSFDTRNVTDLSNMFRGAENLRTVNVSGWNTSNVTNMREMFFACPYVTYFDLSSFDTRNVRDMTGMFDWCTFTQRINLSSFNTHACTSMDRMFEGCIRLMQLDVGPSFSFVGNGSTWCVFPEGNRADYWWYNDWYSTALGAWLLPESIPGSYSNFATTYQRTEAAPYIPASQESPFSDVPNGEWYTKAISSIAGKGLISGYSGTNIYGVNDVLSRAQFAMILWRYSDPASAMVYDDAVAAVTPNGTGLSDVEGYVWYTAAANWAVSNNVINGFADANGVYYAFGPNDSVSFEQLIRILYNLLGNGEVVNDSVLDRFADRDQVSDWAVDSMAWAVSKGLVNGSDGYILPGEGVSRARAAMVLNNAFELGVLV